MSSSTEQILELSIEETNELRQELGLAPLRITKTDDTTNDSKQEDVAEEVLELSVDATNELRERLGLAPLRTSESKKVVMAPAPNQAEEAEAKERIERARLKRQVQEGIQKFQSQASNQEQDASLTSWVEKMRNPKKQQQQQQESADDVKTTVPRTTTASKKSSKNKAAYQEDDLKGLHVGHAVSELQEGSTTVLTLADESLLETDPQSKKTLGLATTQTTALENVSLKEAQTQQEGLRKKRQLEMGMGRAGGYAGYDDDEFEELGGTQGPSRLSRGSGMEDAPPKVRGFQIGGKLDQEEDSNKTKTDLFATHAISLEPAKPDVAASDYMTVEEDQATRKPKKPKKLKKRSKKDKKKHRKRRVEDDDDEEEDDTVVPSKNKGGGLLAELEATAVQVSSDGRKRRRLDESEDTVAKEATAVDKRAKFDQAMAKGNARTLEKFQEPSRKEASLDDDEEEDDAFLNAALAKARRLHRLRDMTRQQERGADVVVKAVQSNKDVELPATTVGTTTFAVDDTREFTRALRARAEQTERQRIKKEAQKEADKGPSTKPQQNSTTAVKQEDEDPEDMDIEQLSKQIKEDDEVPDFGGFDGTTSNAASLGRGLGNVLSLLKHRGDISRKHAGKEELRGRAKDKRTYEDYEKLDLNKVVKIGENATELDKEFANREIKLEYRDKHGRLLTRKEAYRELCYQFHGHGSSMKNQERRLRQMEREQIEARLASRPAGEEGAGAGTLGALKATQKATGKAFVVHKT